MSYSLTGIAYFLGFVATGLLANRFFLYWQLGKNTLSRALYLFVSIFALFMLIGAVGGLFFANNSEALKIVTILSAFVQSFAIATLAFIIVHIKIAKFPFPLLAFITFLLLGFASTILTAVIPFLPFSDGSGGINWDIQLLPGVFRTILFLLTFLPIITITAQQFKNAEDEITKTKSFGLLLVLGFGVFIAFFDFFLINVLKLPAISSATATIIFSVIVFTVIFFTRKVPNNK